MLCFPPYTFGGLAVSHTARFSGRALLDILCIDNATVVYVKNRRPVEVRYRQHNGKERPFFYVRDRHIRADLLVKAIQTDDPSLLDQATPRAPRGLTPRDLEILQLLQNGATYNDVGERFSISRQRVKQIADKLSWYGHIVSPIDARRKRAHDGYEAKLQTRYGYKYKEVLSDTELAAKLKTKLKNKRTTALAKGIPFALTISDIYPLPARCPVLDIPINFNAVGAEDAALSIDRIDPSRGYTPDNIVLVSQRANRIKNDATVEELERIAQFYKHLTTHKDRTESNT